MTPTQAVAVGESPELRRRWWVRLRDKLRLGVAHRTPRSGYDAFISYNQKADSDVAHALQRSLQGFARPWYRVRALRVFRDVSSLAATAGLLTAIEGVLSHTRFLILLASPEARDSPWVAREVKHWCDEKTSQTLLIALTAGDVVWDDATGDFDWAKTTALPTTLVGRFSEEPLWVDIKWARNARRLGPRHPEWREATATLAATLHDKARDELIGDDLRHHRRAIQIAAAAGALIVSFGAVATWQSIAARIQRDHAREEAAQATSLALASASARQLASHPSTALILALEAFRTRQRAETRGAVFDARRAVAASGAGPILRHPGRAEAAAFTPDGRTLVSVGDDRMLRVWDVARRREAAFSPLRGHTALVEAVAVAADSRTVATGGWDGTVRFWDVRRGLKTGEPLRPGGHIHSVAFDPSGLFVAVAAGAKVEVYSYPDGALFARLPLDAEVDRVAFSPKGGLLAIAGGTTGDAYIWDFGNGRDKLYGPVHLGGIASSLVFSHDGKTLVIGGDRGGAGNQLGSLTLWDLRSGKETRGNTGTDLVRGLVFADRGRTLIAAGQDGLVARMDAKTLKRTGYLANVGTGIWDLAIAPDGKTVVFPVSDGTLRFWSTRPASRGGTTVRGPHAMATSVSLSEDGRFVAASFKGGEVDIWDVMTGERVHQARQVGAAWTTSFAAFGNALLFTADGYVVLWDLRRGKVITVSQDAPAVTQIALSPDGEKLATGGFFGEVRVWDLRKGRRLGATIGTPHSVGLKFSNFANVRRLRQAGVEFEAPPTPFGQVGFLAFTRDGRSIVIGGDDFKHHTIRVVDLADRRVTASTTLPGLGALAGGVVAPDGTIRWASIKHPYVYLHTLQTGSDDRLRLGGATAAAFSPDGETIVTGADNGAVRPWDVATLKPIGAAIRGDGSQITTIAFSGDGLTVAAAGEDGSVHIWRDLVWPGGLRQVTRLVCLRVGTSLTPSEWADAAPGIPYHATCG